MFILPTRGAYGKKEGSSKWKVVSGKKEQKQEIEKQKQRIQCCCTYCLLPSCKKERKPKWQPLQIIYIFYEK